MTIGRKNEIFTEQKDSEVISNILQQYEFTKEVEATEITYPQLLQHNVSDWDYVLQRSDINGFSIDSWLRRC